MTSTSDRDGSTMSSEDPLRVGLLALFVTSLIVAQVTASKLLAFSLPVCCRSSATRS